MYFCSKSLGMTSKMKMKIKAGFFAGVFISLILAGIDFLSNKNFSWITLLIRFLVFGFIMGIAVKERKILKND
jgi:hypothetical protein